MNTCLVIGTIREDTTHRGVVLVRKRAREREREREAERERERYIYIFIYIYISRPPHELPTLVFVSQKPY